MFSSSSVLVVVNYDTGRQNSVRYAARDIFFRFRSGFFGGYMYLYLVLYYYYLLPLQLHARTVDYLVHVL